VAELADALDLGSSGATRQSSSLCLPKVLTGKFLAESLEENLKVFIAKEKSSATNRKQALLSGSGWPEPYPFQGSGRPELRLRK
jgi:hypothetical protein